MITGKTTMIAHIGWPTESFKAPMTYNPWFEAHGIDAVVMPFGVEAADYPDLLRGLFRIRNLHGALVTMPHKITTMGLVDEVTPTAQIAGACNAVLRRPDGSLLGDMFDGAGFVRGVERKGRPIAGARALVVGCGGVGCAIGVPGGGGAGGHHPVRPRRRVRRGAGGPAAAARPGVAGRHRVQRP